MTTPCAELRPVTPAFNPDPDRCGEYDYRERHGQIITLIRQQAWDVVFIGDSNIHYWCGEPAARFVRGAQSWARYYGARRVVNLGCGWDRTEHVLWRIQQGELDGVTTPAVVLLIGANNLASGDTATATAAGLAAVGAAIAGKLPQANLVALGLLPRGRTADDAFRAPTAETNRLVAQWAANHQVHFLDAGDRLLQPDGSISPETMSDFLHLAERGYELLAQALEPTLTGLLRP